MLIWDNGLFNASLDAVDVRYGLILLFTPALVVRICWVVLRMHLQYQPRQVVFKREVGVRTVPSFMCSFGVLLGS